MMHPTCYNQQRISTAPRTSRSPRHREVSRLKPVVSEAKSMWNPSWGTASMQKTSLIDMPLAVRKCQASIGPLVFLMLTFRMSPFLMPSLCQECQNIWELGGAFKRGWLNQKMGLSKNAGDSKMIIVLGPRDLGSDKSINLLLKCGWQGVRTWTSTIIAVSIGPIGKAN